MFLYSANFLLNYVLGDGPPDSFRDTSPSQFAVQYIQEPTFRAQEETYCGMWKPNVAMNLWYSIVVIVKLLYPVHRPTDTFNNSSSNYIPASRYV